MIRLGVSALLVTLFALYAGPRIPEHVSVTETFHFSRTCPGADGWHRVYVDDDDDHENTVTFECDYNEGEEQQ